MDARQWIVQRSRLIAPPQVGATRYVIKVSPITGPTKGAATYRFQQTIPKTIGGNVSTVRGELGIDGDTLLHACGRWRVVSDDGIYVTLEQAA